MGALRLPPPMLLIGIILLFQATTTDAITKDMVFKRLLKDYDPTIRPGNGTSGQPTRVEVNYYARDFYVIDQSMAYVGIQLTFRQKWNDDRLSYPETQFKYLSTSDPKKLWLADIFFSNSRQGHFNILMEPNVLLRIYPNGDVLYSRRVTADFKCRTNNAMFPLNRLSCPVIAASYGFTTEDVILEWAPEKPVQMSSKVSISTYKMSLVGTFYCTSRTITGEYSCLKGIFNLERGFGSVFYILYLPPLMLVLLAWLSFFMHRRALKLRLSLLLVGLLLGSLCCANAQWNDPEKMVLTAADAWSGLCLGFMIYAFLHFIMTRSLPCLAQLCGYESKDEDMAPTGNDITLQPMMPNDGGEQGGDQGKMKGKLQVTSARLRHLMAKKGNRADVIARMLFPSAFIVLNIVYWAVYKEGELET